MRAMARTRLRLDGSPSLMHSMAASQLREVAIAGVRSAEPALDYTLMAEVLVSIESVALQVVPINVRVVANPDHAMRSNLPT